jgi:hypothetical protein
MVQLNDLRIHQLQIKISWSYRYIAPRNLSFFELELLLVKLRKYLSDN